MAINIDSIYKSVLSILNKEQRGYITPDEFNKIGKQMQLSLLDQSFTQYNKSINLQNTHATNEGYADLPQNIQNKIDVFYKTSDITLSNGIGTLPTDLYKIINLSISNQTIKLEKVDKDKIPYLLSSPLTRPSETFPIYYTRVSDIIVEPALSDLAWTGGAVKAEYIKVPSSPRWGYSIDATYGTNIYDDRVFVDTGLVTGVGELTSSSASTDLTGTDGSYEFIKAVSGGNGWINGVGTGIGAKLKITVDSNVFTVDVIDVGSGFAIGDTIIISTARDTDISSNHMNLNSNLVITLSATDIYNSSTIGSTNFELHESEESNLILGILSYCGITIKDPTITQQAGQILQANETVKQQ
jgi:hypothetical protein